MAMQDQNEQSLLQDVDRIANSLEKIATSLETLVARDRLTEPLGENFSEEDEEINDTLNKVFEETDDPLKVIECWDKIKVSNEESVDDTENISPNAVQDKEQRISITQEIVNKFRTEGKTWPWIADYLNNNGFPTISGKGKWHRQSVSALIKNVELDSEKL